MKKLVSKIILILIICSSYSCKNNKSPYFDSILKSENGQFRGVEIGCSIEAVKAIEDSNFLKDQMDDYLHYDYEIDMGNGYTVSYDFSQENELYEIELAVYLDVIEDASVLFNNLQEHYNKKYKIGKKEDDGYMTWHTHSSITENKIAISMINDSEEYGYLTVLIRDLDY